MPNCPHQGEFRAPKSRSELREYHWFCLEHVRAYNAGWDFYKNMSADEIEAELRADSSWQRPTWPLGQLGSHSRMDEALEAELNAFAFGQHLKAARQAGAPPELRDALNVLDLGWPVTLEEVKTRYKELAKRHHPDANRGDKACEERLKVINLAYATLRGKLAANQARTAETVAD